MHTAHRHTGNTQPPGIKRNKCSRCHLFEKFFFGDRDFYSPGCTRTHFVDLAGLKLKNQPASAYRVMGLKVCVTTPGLFDDFLTEVFHHYEERHHLEKEAEQHLRC